MPTYKIISSDERGAYCVVTRDDGSTFGQHVSGNDAITIAGIEKAVAQSVARVEAAPLLKDAAIDAAVSAGAIKAVPMDAVKG